MAVFGGVGAGSDTGEPELDPLGRPSAEGPSEESEEHDVRATNTAATTTARTALDDVLRIMAPWNPSPPGTPPARAGVAG